MKAVLDASAFFSDYTIPGELYTVPSVTGELIDPAAQVRFDSLVEQGLMILPPSEKSCGRVIAAARRTGDAGILSKTDCELVALALELGAAIYSDDFAVRNTAEELGIPVHPLRQRRSRTIIWRFRCSGCGRYYDHAGECPVCGSGIKRKLK